MSTLVNEIRRMTNASSNDATDLDIQRELDRARRLVTEEVCWHPEQIGAGTYSYRLGRVRPWGLFQAGTAGFSNVGTIRDSWGTIKTNWSISEDGWIEFTSPGSIGSARHFTGYSYDIYRAAASLLEDMASAQLRQYDVTLGGDQQMRSQKAKALQEQAQYFRKKQLSPCVEVIRSDEQW